jgi:hypothetical protein
VVRYFRRVRFAPELQFLGEEALAPPTKQNDFALFGLRELDSSGCHFSSATIRNNGYKAEEGCREPRDPDRSFNGFSGSAGMRVSRGRRRICCVLHALLSRATLEELYNWGAWRECHVRDRNVDLQREQSDGLDLSCVIPRAKFVRSSTISSTLERLHFSHRREVDDESGLQIANTSRSKPLTGTESKVRRRLEHDSGSYELDYVNAKLTDTDNARSRASSHADAWVWNGNHKVFVSRGGVMSNKQDQIFPTETSTGGYTVFNENGS